MFNKLKSVFTGAGSKEAAGKTSNDAHSALNSTNHVSEWANMQGLSFSQRKDGRGYHVEGKIGSKLWRMEQGNPSRDFIKGEELRARAELDIRNDVAVMVITRQLKDDLEKRAFAKYTDSLQTVVDASLPEEMRWLAMYEEVGWESLGAAFLNNYAIVAYDRDDALAWVSQDLVDKLMAWPHLDPSSPKILMLLKGKAYLRMQYVPGDMAMLEHASVVFIAACELAITRFSRDNRL